MYHFKDHIMSFSALFMKNSILNLADKLHSKKHLLLLTVLLFIIIVSPDIKTSFKNVYNL